jgi:hypothetical protein
MATIYKAEIVSYWVAYDEETIKKALEIGLKELNINNEITIDVKRK